MITQAKELFQCGRIPSHGGCCMQRPIEKRWTDDQTPSAAVARPSDAVRWKNCGWIDSYPVPTSQKPLLQGCPMIDDADLTHLRRCLVLARTALQNGDSPFGSVLVAADGRILFEDHNHDSIGDPMQHPEIAAARWAVQNLTTEQRAVATVYTSGEHCVMCAAAHGWAGLGRIVYASSSAQTSRWLAELNAAPAPVRALPVTEVAPNVPVDGPVDDLAEEVHELHRQYSRSPQRRRSSP